MYTSFFGLNEKPFTITPDPRYLFMSERHGEGLAHLVYGVTESGGFIQLTGEVGTGKTTLVRTLLGQIPAEVDIALILNPQLTALEFLAAICEELSISLPEERGSKALVDALNLHLLDAHARGRRTILLIDEAQNLADDVLEQLRLLTNLETARQKLLQIILIAQPELREKLAQNHLRQLAQRVTGRYHLDPLSRAETDKYIDHRLRVAGALTEIFDAQARREVFRLSGGVPRVINVICDRALLGAYSAESRTVSRTIVRRAAQEVSGKPERPSLRRWLAPALAIAGITVIGAALWAMMERSPPAVAEPAAAVATLAVATPAPALDSPAEEMPAMGPQPTPPAEDSPDLESWLSDVSDGSVSGITTLLSMWGIDYNPAAGAACSQAAAAGFSCYFQRGSWNGIRQLDRPVVLTLTDSDGRTYQPALTRLDGDEAELALGPERMTFPAEAVEHLWFGQYVLIWNPPGDSPVVISPGMQNEDVRWLRQSLAALDAGYDVGASNPNYYDEALQQQVIAFQRKHRLQSDGLAGQKTQIIINSLLSPDGSPRLTMPQ